MVVALALGAALALVAVLVLVAAGFFSFSSFLVSVFLGVAGLASFFASFTVPEAPEQDVSTIFDFLESRVQMQ